MKKAVFYHAGCTVCVSAENSVLNMIDRKNIDLQVVDLGKDKAHLAEAEDLGIKSVPALVIDNQVLHINYGAALSDLK
ncbi:MAG: conjugal transfer protein TraF [Bdellovibrionaceae bacterium]|nr:conjugal transfer protein TraF [Pseudobdellovibrionaceae bacterium]